MDASEFLPHFNALAAALAAAGPKAAALVGQEYSKYQICLYLAQILRRHREAPSADALLASLDHSIETSNLLVKAVKLGLELASLLNISKFLSAALWEKARQRKESLTESVRRSTARAEEERKQFEGEPMLREPSGNEPSVSGFFWKMAGDRASCFHESGSKERQEEQE